MASTPTTNHVVLFPFMSKGHTIPIFDLARLLLARDISITIFTTPSNRPFFSESLSGTNVNIIQLPFPQNIDENIPPGIESTDKLPSMSLFPLFANATKSMKPDFDKALESILPITFMVTDGFLGWTVESAHKYGIPRLVYYGMNAFSPALSVSAGPMLRTDVSEDEPFAVPDFPWIKLTRNDFDHPFREREPKGPDFEFVMEQVAATSKSYGVLINSFYELESVYVNYCQRETGSKSWCIGPFCANVSESRYKNYPDRQKPAYVKWLDEMLEQGKPVLYVAFGSQAEISDEQFEEIKIGLEKSGVNFLWVVRGVTTNDDGFENRVKNRGIVVTEWVDQREILNHGSVQGFLSHCGWNSVVESICAKVPILAWPMMAEQHLNARMVVEVIKTGLRVETSNGSVRGFVNWQGLAKPVKELMEGEKGKQVKRKTEEIGEAAINAVKQGGSSWKALNQLIDELTSRKTGLKIL